MSEVLTCNGVPALYRVINMPGDGSCMFHSLSYIMHGHIRMSMNIKAAIVAHVLANWCRFQPFTFAEDGNPFPSMEAYQASMLLPETFGTFCELHAAGELYPFQFQVYRNGNLLWSCGEDNQPVKKLRFAGNLNSGHFDVYEAETPVVMLTRLPEVTVFSFPFISKQCNPCAHSQTVGRPKKIKRGRKKIVEAKIDKLERESKKKKEAKETETAEESKGRLKTKKNSMKEAREKKTAKNKQVRLKRTRNKMKKLGQMK